MVENNCELKLQQYVDELKNDPEFIAESLSIKIVEEMLSCLEKKGLNQSWMADQLGVTRAHISKILNAPPNMTLLTIAKIAVALGVDPDVCFKPRSKEKQNVEPSKFTDLSQLQNGLVVNAEAKTGGTASSTTELTVTNITLLANNPEKSSATPVSSPRTQVAIEERELVLAA